MKLIIITLIFTTFLSAEYLRSIRLGSFNSQSKAQVELEKVQVFVKKHSNIRNFQKIWDFEFKIKKSGEYYLIIATPMRDKEVLQEVINTLRLSYLDAYVRKLHFAPEFRMKKEILEVKEEIKQEATEKEIPEPILKPIAEVIVVPKLEPKSELLIVPELEPKPEVIAVPVLDLEKEFPLEKVLKRDKENTQEREQETKVTEMTPKITPEIATQVVEVEDLEVLKHNFDEENTSKIYQILFYMSLLFLLVVSVMLYRERKKNRDATYREIRHKDSFLTHAKNSVATINNFTNLLLAFDLSFIQKDYVQRIRSSSEHLLQTVNNMLDITKLRNKTLKIENTKFDLNEMLHKVSQIISLEAKNNDTVFSLNVEEGVPSFIFGDQAHIRQVLINLLGNSVKFTQGGRISLTIKPLYSYTHAITLGFIIKDTGLGMNTQQVNDILEPHSEIAEDGTVGLGLSVSKQLIEMMDGKIKIYSTQDVGTTFTFTLKFNIV